MRRYECSRAREKNSFAQKFYRQPTIHDAQLSRCNGSMSSIWQSEPIHHVHLQPISVCTTPDEINDIIAAELASLTEDPDGYKVVSEFMLHGPCSKDAKYAPCTIEGKCLKHYPKVFLEETVIDEYGYLIYRRQNNKVTAKKGKFTYSNQHVVPYNRYPALQLTDEHIRNYCLLEIQKLLNRHGRSLAEFQDLPRPNLRLLTNLENRLIREALDFDVNKSRAEHAQLHSLLNPEQRMVYDKVTESVYNESGIASLLLLGGRIAHSRFFIPLELLENSTCSIKQNTHLAELMQKVKLHIVLKTYPNFITRQYDESYLKERAIRTPRTDDADAINEFISEIGGASVTYHSADEICKASTSTEDQHHLYPVEFLNTLNFLGMPPHALCLKRELPVMLIRNLNPALGLCNGTRLIITELFQFIVRAKILTGSHIRDIVVMHRIVLSLTQTKWLFTLKRRQLPLKPCYAMTINKSQGQSINYVGLYLPTPTFCHDQICVALSRVTSPDGLKILMIEDEDCQTEMHHTRNIVFKETFISIS
ncbi:ATP-dependent DNA helicase PIF1-like protein [Tanacetum coccineum]